MVMGSGRFYVIMYSACYSGGRAKYLEIRVWERLVWNSIFKFDYLVFIFICNEFNERSVNNFQVQSLNWWSLFLDRIKHVGL